MKPNASGGCFPCYAVLIYPYAMETSEGSRLLRFHLFLTRVGYQMRKWVNVYSIRNGLGLTAGL